VAIARLATNFLVGVSPLDPPTYIAASATCDRCTRRLLHSGSHGNAHAYTIPALRLRAYGNFATR